MILDYEKAASSLGERLLAGVRNLWADVQRLSKVINHQGQEIEDIKRRVDAAERELKSLRISRGMQRAKNAKLEASLAESATKLKDIKLILRETDGPEQHPN
jgi:septal ring factor EnvC (AmiA/AmiB activator)